MLTIVIPTKNRAPFLKRLLRYYMDVRCPFRVLIGDSSSPDQMEETSQFLFHEVKNRLQVTHLTYHGAREVQSKGWQADSFMSKLIGYVKTPYVAFYADDDFAIVPNLQKAVDFLETHPDFSFVCGEAILFTLKSPGTVGEVEGTNRYPQGSFNQCKVSERLESLFSNYIGLEYGVSRTVQKQERWGRVFDAKVNNIGGEVINTAFVVIQGKVYKMDEMLLVRQGHLLQSSRGESDSFNLAFRGCSTDSLVKLKTIFCNSLQKAEKDLSREETEHIIKKCLWSFLVDHLRALYVAQSPKGFRRRLLEAVKKNRDLKKCGLYLYSLTSQGKMKLPALLRPSSPYYKDFLPVYRVITNS
ncbi:MAG: TIGR00180 family glycosyltransferase [Deltaproteobacteria bacterium]|nr:TIGR00180 family glycosyltransferase [Deltaproteobacteria bacterium]